MGEVAIRRSRLIVGAVVVSSLVVGPASFAAARPAGGARIQVIAASGHAPRPALPRAGTSVVLGQTTFSILGGCAGGVPFGVLAGTTGGGASYTAPSAGVITSWSTVGGGAAGTSRLLLFVNGTLANHRTLVGKSDFMPVPIDFGVVHTFPARIPVQAGWQLGMGTSVTKQACALNVGIAGDVLRTQANFNADTSTDFTFTSATTAFRPDISAVLESDADGDGFGDVSQDACPESGATQVACPAPDTKVTKAPKKKSAKRYARIRFTSPTAGSTFTCAVDGKRAKPCSSPFRKRFRYGKHAVVVTAVSGLGIADPTPVTVKFRVNKPLG